MPKNTLKNSVSTQSQIFELLGRTLYVCNFIELRLRWMHQHRGGLWTGKTPEELLDKLKKVVEKQQKGDKAPLGPIGQEMLDAIYTPRCDKDLENAKEQKLFALKLDYKIQSNGRFRRAKTKFKKFIETRNYLVHYFARDYDLANEDSCKKAYADLKNKSAIIKDALEFFNEDYEMTQKTLKELQEHFKKMSSKPDFQPNTENV